MENRGAPVNSENPYQTPSAEPLQFSEGVRGGTNELWDNTKIARITIVIILSQAVLRWASDLLIRLWFSERINHEAVPFAVIRALEPMTALTSITAIICYCIWIYRTASNAERLTGRRLSIRPGMAVAWYFIPLLNAVVPCLSMKEIVKFSFQGCPEKSPSALVAPWWVSILGAFVLLALTNARVVPSLFGNLAFVSLIAAAVFISLIILRTTEIQTKRLSEPSGPQ